jgi:2'-5' RNA ligase
MMPPMRIAVTLCFDPACAVLLEGMWRTLAEQNIDSDRHQLGYAPHITLAIYPDETLADQVGAALERIAPAWQALPIALAGLGIFPGATSILWAAPVVTTELLNRHMDLQAALPGFPVDPHYRPGSWVPHVTLSGALPDAGQALAVLTSRWRPVSGFLSRLELVRFRPVELLKSHTLECRNSPR